MIISSDIIVAGHGEWSPMEFLFNLKAHCVETEAKKIYERLIRRYLDKTCPEKEKSGIESEMDALKFFLENADFRGLRSKYPVLSGSDDPPFVTLDLREKKGDIGMTIKEERVVLKKESIWKKF